MIPSAANSDYPKFVADQVLTSDNLNDLFGYLDEQGRMTRTNLSGIGIVFGLKVKTAADGSSITISKGVGVTSSGYLVSVPEITYTKRSSAIYDAVKSEYYNRFVNVASKTQKFNLWELKQEAEAEGNTALTKTFLTSGEKIVLLFVELLEENNKNCDPNSCDDKGINVTVNFRPLLIEKANIDAFLTGAGAPASPWLTLPDLTMKRFDVTATPLFECLNFFDAYRKILNTTFLNQVQTSLTKSYDVLQPLLAGEFPTNPFASLANDFKFLNDGSITPEQLLFMQYYYDLVSDLILAYNEFREKGMEFIGMCCPDDLFPRHLLLDLAIPDTSVDVSSYRHYFIPSPILSDQEKTASQLKMLFKKLVLMLDKFTVPPSNIGFDKKTDSSIRITPSILANVPFSTKSIPYYYAINGASDELLKNWSPLKYIQGKSNRNLSYHAKKYNTTDEAIFEPLLYDLEPYNFLRIEGHIGKSYLQAVKTITDIRNKNRLPFEVVALNADVSAITSFIKDLGKLMTSGTNNAQPTLESLMGTSCHFNDLELLYDAIMSELTGKLSNEMKFFYDLKRDGKRPPLKEPANNIPQVPLLKNTDAAFQFTTNSIGHEFELFYENVKDVPYIPILVFFQSFGQDGSNDVMDFVFKAVLYYIEMLYETVTTSLSSFTFFDFYIRYYSLVYAVRYIKFLNKVSGEQFPLSEEENDHLDAILSITADNRMVQLYIEFLRRLLQIKVMQQAGFYTISHPGIQHKAGVPFGGTFVVVYHEAEKVEVAVKPNTTFNENLAFKANNEKVDSSRINSGTQKLNAEASTQDHLRLLTADVHEKVGFVRDRVISGLEKTINVEKLGTKKVVEEAAAAAVQPTEVKASAADSVAAAAAVNTTTTTTSAISTAEKSQEINERILNYLSDAATYIKNRKADKLDEAIAEFNDGMVIADFYLPYQCCSDCPPIQMIVTGEPEKPNQPPVARPGDTISIQLPVNFAKLDGSKSSDPDGTINSYLWELKSGTNAKIEKPNESITDVSSLSEGTYVFKLTVTDNDGASSSATVSVIVLPLVNVPPVAVAKANPGNVTLSANGAGIAEISGSNSNDPDGEIKAFKWSLKPGPTGGAIIADPTSETSLVTFTQPGVYVFELIVTDNQGATGTTTVNVTVVQKENLSPVAVATATPSALILVGDEHVFSTLDGSNSTDPEGKIASMSWALSSGQTSGFEIDNPDKETTQVSFNQPGAYSFKLTVTDDQGLSDTTTVTVTVTQEIIVEKTCAPLDSIISGFIELANSDTAENFKLFTARYVDFREIRVFYNLMVSSKVQSMTIEAQIKFFIDQKIESRLPVWIDNLKPFLLEFENLRRLSLLMLNIHSELAYYIACIQKEDVNKAAVKMADALKSESNLLSDLTDFVANFPDDLRNILTTLRTVTTAERSRIKSNNELTVKPIYVEILAKTLGILKAMNL